MRKLITTVLLVIAAVHILPQAAAQDLRRDELILSFALPSEMMFYDNYDDYQYDGYPTKCTMTAEQQEKVNESGHYNWKVVFECYRTEREGYACEFHSAPSLVYTSGTAASLSWEECNGSATMLVTKNGEKVDLVRMDYLGTSTRYFRGL